MFYLKKIKLINFKCFSNVDCTFSPFRNVIIGINAVGKTSLVEAIHCLCFGRTFKNIKDHELITKGEQYYNIKALFNNDNEEDNVLVSYNSQVKIIKKNNNLFKTISEYIGYFNVIVFSPDDLELVKGAPNVRRKFLDTNIGQINKQYLTNLINYKNILKERNEYLKETNTYDEVFLEVITKSLIEYSKEIISYREKFIKQLNTFVSQISNEITKGQEKVEIVYKPNVIVDNLWINAKEKLNYDKSIKTTSWGPNRDDFLVTMNGEVASTYCSQGQIRSACLAIKLGLSELIKQINNRVIVILDDVFSELDENRQNQVMKLLENNNQTFITATSIENLSTSVIKDSKIIEISERGKI